MCSALPAAITSNPWRTVFSSDLLDNWKVNHASTTHGITEITRNQNSIRVPIRRRTVNFVKADIAKSYFTFTGFAHLFPQFAYMPFRNASQSCFEREIGYGTGRI